MRPPEPADHARGLEFWMLRHLEESLSRLHWVVPCEKLDEFCLLWALESGRRLAQQELRVNASGPDDVDVAALRRWLRDRPERFAVDSLLWSAARRRYETWREALVGLDRETGEPAPGALAWGGPDGAAVWLLRNWHPPVARGGWQEWSAGPGTFSTIKLRRRGRAALRCASRPWPSSASAGSASGCCAKRTYRRSAWRGAWTTAATSPATRPTWAGSGRRRRSCSTRPRTSPCCRRTPPR